MQELTGTLPSGPLPGVFAPGSHWALKPAPGPHTIGLFKKKFKSELWICSTPADAIPHYGAFISRWTSTTSATMYAYHLVHTQCVRKNKKEFDQLFNITISNSPTVWQMSRFYTYMLNLKWIVMISSQFDERDWEGTLAQRSVQMIIP